MEPEPDGMVVERFFKDFALLLRLDREEEEDEFCGIFSSKGKGYMPGNCGTYSPGLEPLAPRKEYLSALKRYLSCSAGVMVSLVPPSSSSH